VLFLVSRPWLDSGWCLKEFNLALRYHAAQLRPDLRLAQTHADRARSTNEIFATAAAAGIPSEGAAGSSIESVSKLRCTLDPNEILQKAGGGAECSFETGQ
jgi:hypothetical protein